MARVVLHEYCDEARDLIESRRYDEAIAICRHILLRYPKHAETYRILGEACLQKGELDEAADAFKRLLSADPENFVAYAGLGVIYEEKKQIAEAIWYMERAFEMASSNEEIRNALRRLYGQRDGTEPTRIKLNKVALARLYARGGQHRQAVEELRRSLELEPARVDLQVSLAETLWRDGHREQAVEIAREILKGAPYCLKATLLLGAIQIDKGRGSEGQATLARARAVDPECRVAQALFGERSPLPLVAVKIPRKEDTPTAGETTLEPIEIPFEEHEPLSTLVSQDEFMAGQAAEAPAFVPAQAEPAAAPVTAEPVAMMPPAQSPESIQEQQPPTWLVSEDNTEIAAPVVIEGGVMPVQLPPVVAAEEQALTGGSETCGVAAPVMIPFPEPEQAPAAAEALTEQPTEISVVQAEAIPTTTPPSAEGEQAPAAVATEVEQPIEFSVVQAEAIPAATPPSVEGEQAPAAVATEVEQPIEFSVVQAEAVPAATPPSVEGEQAPAAVATEVEQPIEISVVQAEAIPVATPPSAEDEQVPAATIVVAEQPVAGVAAQAEAIPTTEIPVLMSAVEAPVQAESAEQLPGACAVAEEAITSPAVAREEAELATREPQVMLEEPSAETQTAPSEDMAVSPSIHAGQPQASSLSETFIAEQPPSVEPLSEGAISPATAVTPAATAGIVVSTEPSVVTEPVAVERTQPEVTASPESIPGEVVPLPPEAIAEPVQADRDLAGGNSSAIVIPFPEHIEPAFPVICGPSAEQVSEAHDAQAAPAPVFISFPDESTEPSPMRESSLPPAPSAVVEPAQAIPSASTPDEALEPSPSDATPEPTGLPAAEDIPSGSVAQVVGGFPEAAPVTLPSEVIEPAPVRELPSEPTMPISIESTQPIPAIPVVAEPITPIQAPEQPSPEPQSLATSEALEGVPVATPPPIEQRIDGPGVPSESLPGASSSVEFARPVIPTALEQTTGGVHAQADAGPLSDVERCQVQLQQNPKDDQARLALARAFRGQEQMEQALDQYSALSRAKPNILSDVVSDVESIVASRPDNLAAHELLADLYTKSGQLQKGLDRYRWLLTQLEHRPA